MNIKSSKLCTMERNTQRQKTKQIGTVWAIAHEQRNQKEIDILNKINKIIRNEKRHIY